MRGAKFLSRDAPWSPSALRLAVAVGVSAALHLAIIAGIGVRPFVGHAAPALTIEARLVRPDPPAAAGQAKAQTLAGRTTQQPGDTGSRGEAHAPALPSQTVPPPEPDGKPQVEIPVVADRTFYPAKELDVYPKPLDEIAPDYPPRAADEALEGEVTLQLLIDENGTVTEASVVQAYPEGYFEESAVSAFRAARFRPGQKDGQAVRSRVIIKVNYALDSARRNVN